MAFRLDRTPLAPPVRRADGTVVYEGALTRTGVFKYTQPDGSIRREYRSPAEVGRADSLRSAQLMHVVDDHPEARGQAKDRAVGSVGDDVRFDGKVVTAKVMVRADAVNAKVANGKCQLSCGYDTVLVETPGVAPDGERYDVLQTQIVYEHVAIVAAGRAGPEVRLRLDALEAEDRDDTSLKLSAGGCFAGCYVTSTSLSGVDLERAATEAVTKIPGAVIERVDSVRADGTAVQASKYGAPSVWVSTRDLSLDDLASQLAAAMGPGVTVKRGDAAQPPLHQDTAAMDLAAQLAAAVKDATEQRARADAAEKERDTARAATATEKARADKAEGERDTHKDRADAADKARKDAVDQGPALARARVKLEDKAVAVIGAEFKADGLSDHDVRLKVLDKLGTKVDTDKRGNADFIAARYDGAIETYDAAAGNVNGARGPVRKPGDDKPQMTEAEAMAEAKRRTDARSQPAKPGASA